MKRIKELLKKLHRYLKRGSQEVTRLEVENTLPQVGPKSRLRKRLSAIAGLVILLMAIVGVVFSSMFFYHIHLHKEEETYREKVNYYQNFIAPVVLFDTGEFIDPNNANNLSLLIPAFFKAQETAYADIEERESITGKDVATRYIIRSEDVDAAARRLFGRSVIFQSFSLDGLLFEYVENEKYFLSPLTLRIGMYTPNITQITPTETGVDLTVEYVEVAAEEQYTVRKTMKISLQGEYKQEIITAVTAAQ
ncbi:MAG: hypothetical protein IKM39_02510 [Clostridia bacterium]|nr:hypothetical protein [Clostridia bacterium]